MKEGKNGSMNTVRDRATEHTMLLVDWLGSDLKVLSLQIVHLRNVERHLLCTVSNAHLLHVGPHPGTGIQPTQLMENC